MKDGTDENANDDRIWKIVGEMVGKSQNTSARFGSSNSVNEWFEHLKREDREKILAYTIALDMIRKYER